MKTAVQAWIFDVFDPGKDRRKRSALHLLIAFCLAHAVLFAFLLAFISAGVSPENPREIVADQVNTAGMTLPGPAGIRVVTLSPPPAEANSPQNPKPESPSGNEFLALAATETGDLKISPLPGKSGVKIPANDFGVTEPARLLNPEILTYDRIFQGVSRSQKVEGRLWVAVDVDAHGKYTSHKIVKCSDPLLKHADLSVLDQLKFQPAKAGEQFVRSWTLIPMHFVPLK